jgi:hypothetical protein
LGIFASIDVHCAVFAAEMRRNGDGRSLGRVPESRAWDRRRSMPCGSGRADITPLIGLCYSYDRPDWQEPVTRLVDVFVDGLVVKR